MKTIVLSPDSNALKFNEDVINIEISNLIEKNIINIKRYFDATCRINYYNDYDLELLISLKNNSFINIDLNDINIVPTIFKGSKKITYNNSDYLQCLELQDISIDYTNIKLLYIQELNKILENIKKLLLIIHKNDYDKIVELTNKENFIKISSENLNYQKEHINDKVKLFIVPLLSFNEIVEKHLNFSNMTFNIKRHIVFDISFEYNNKIYTGRININKDKFECGNVSIERDINNKIYFNKRLSSNNLKLILKNIVNKTIEYETNFYNQQERINKQYRNCLDVKEFLLTLIPNELINICKYTEQLTYILPGQSRYIDAFYTEVKIKDHKYKVIFNNNDEILFNGLYLSKEQFEKIIKILLQE